MPGFQNIPATEKKDKSIISLWKIKPNQKRNRDVKKTQIAEKKTTIEPKSYHSDLSETQYLSDSRIY
jgi:hypothetical protein